MVILNNKIKIHIKNNRWKEGSFPNTAAGEKVFSITNEHLILFNVPNIECISLIDGKLKWKKSLFNSSDYPNWTINGLGCNFTADNAGRIFAFTHDDHLIEKENTPLYKSHKKYGFVEPVKYYVPSIGISEIEKIPKKFNKEFDNDFFIASMGNIQEESSFSASVEEASGGGGLGIIQWTGDRRTKLESAASDAGINLTDNEAALLFELNYLWDGEYGSMTWQKQVNTETTVEGNTAIASFNNKFSSQLAESQEGNGSTMVFHALIERSNDVPTATDKYDGVGVLDERIASAQGFLEEFGNGANNNCSIGAGGLSWDQAVAVGQKLVDDWDTVYCGEGSIKNGKYCNWGPGDGYCTAGAAWMVDITAPDRSRASGIPDGAKVADTLIAVNSDVYTSVNPDGSNLRPFSVWSVDDNEYGHTGTIVGLGTDGSIITLEVNWGWGEGGVPGNINSFQYNSGHKVAVYQFPDFEAFKLGHPGYTYVNTATPKDSSITTAMGEKMMEFISN